MSVLAKGKPPIWNIIPSLTDDPEIWRDAGLVLPFWEGSGSTLRNRAITWASYDFGSSLGWSQNTHGLEAFVNTGYFTVSGEFYLARSNTNILEVDGQYSILFAGRALSTGTGDDQVIAASNLGVNSVFFDINNDVEWRIFGGGGAATISLSSLSYNFGDFFTAVVRGSVPGDTISLKVRANGITSSTVFTTLGSNGNKNWAFFAEENGDDTWRGYASILAFVNEIISDEKREKFLNDPFAMLRPRSDL